MRLVNMFGIAALAAVAVIGVVGVPSASSATSTQLCDAHASLTCSSGTSAVHLALETGTVLRLLSPISVLCLGELWELDSLGLSSPQILHTTVKSSTGCGTGSAHNNCTLTLEGNPLVSALKTGLDQGTGEIVDGGMRLVCSNLGINCLYDLEGLTLSLGAQHATMNETPVTELGGKFFCPDEGYFDGLLQTLATMYVLG